MIINAKFHQSVLSLTLVVWSVAASAQTGGRVNDYVTMGASEVNITPQEPVMMSGYDARRTPSTGVHDSLFASALFFSARDRSALIITADLIGFPTRFVDTLKEVISARTKISRDNILLIAAHNHGGPAIHTYEAQLPEANERYIRNLKEKLVTLAVNASKEPKPFSMGIGKGLCSLNINRRAVFADGGVWLGRNADGVCDHELDAIKFVDEKNKLIAVLINWPCHGTVSGQENYQLTADWPGAAARFIKKMAGENVVVAVTTGASANINPIYGPGSDFNEVEAVGYHAATEAWKALVESKAFPVRELEVVNSTLRHPGKESWKNQFPQASVGTGADVEIMFSALKLGELVICGISGELMTEMGMAIKQESPYSSTIVVTHCNGSSGYICTDKAFAEGGYEVKVSHLMPGIEKPLVATCLDIIRSF